jgi:ribosomal protein S12 methylthiotransferase accessory factor
MEAAETWHAERISLPLRLARERELEGRVVDTSRLPRAAGCAYDPTRPLLWIEGTSLDGSGPSWLPLEVVHADHTLPPVTGTASFLCSTNGLASGNTLEEAACHALCEVIERDAVALWFRRRLADPAPAALDLAAVRDPACREAIDRCDAAGIELAAWDVTSDLDVPACLCLLIDAREPSGHGGLGAGCHLAPEIALLRAITEAVQVRMTYISGARDDIAAHEYGTGTRKGRLLAARRLAGGSRSRASLDERPNLTGPSFKADLATLRHHLAAADLEAVTVDLTRPELAINVVRAVIPGLEGPDDHPSYRPGPRARAIAP